MKVVFAHGLESGPVGAKSVALREAGFEVIAPDGRGQRLAARIPALVDALRTHPDAILVGSSYGGLAATWLAGAVAVRAVVLCAPALQWTEPPVDDPDALVIPHHVPTVVIHGVHDTVVPIDVSRRLTARCPHVELWERNDDHRLSASRDELIRAVRQLS